MKTTTKLDSLDGLRGIASFVVLIYHLRMTFYPRSFLDLTPHLGSLPYIFKRPIIAIVASFSDGGFAVCLFWVLSAFVLSLRYFRYTNETANARAQCYLEDALLRRYPRLLIPVLSSVIFAYILHVSGLMRNLELARTLGNSFKNEWIATAYSFTPSFSHALHSSFWQSFFDYHEPSTYNMVLWTMEKEFYGSLFLFAFLSLAGHRSSRFILYPIAAFSCYFLGLNWLLAFVAGIAISDCYVNHKKSRYYKILQIAASWINTPWVFPIWILIIACIGLPNYLGAFNILVSTVVIVLTLTSEISKKFLCSRIPTFLGRISFGLYLVHSPIICSFSAHVYLMSYVQIGATNAALLSFFSTCAVSVYLGYLLYKFVDNPSIRMSRIIASQFMRNTSIDHGK